MIVFDALHSLAGCEPGAPSRMALGLAPALFMAGLVGGFTHCTFMCGPFVISQTGMLERPALRNLMLYHFGRLTTYVVLAVLFSGLLSITFAYFPIKQLIAAPLLMTAAIMFLVSAIPSLGIVFPWVTRLRLPVPEQILTRLFKTVSKAGLGSNTQKYAMGVLLGFMPCGLVLSALVAASTAANPAEAGLAMGAFAIGTMPALLITAYGGVAIKKKFPKTFTYVTSMALVWSSILLFYVAGTLLA